MIYIYFSSKQCKYVMTLLLILLNFYKQGMLSIAEKACN